MAAFEINKGVGRTVEFKGLKAQYLFLFAGGLLAVFILVVILYLCGISQITCLVIGVVGASLVVWQTFTMNRSTGNMADEKGSSAYAPTLPCEPPHGLPPYP